MSAYAFINCGLHSTVYHDKYLFTYTIAIDQSSAEHDVPFTLVYAEDLHENPRLKILMECHVDRSRATYHLGAWTSLPKRCSWKSALLKRTDNFI
jgi:hypothetical protein